MYYRDGNFVRFTFNTSPLGMWAHYTSAPMRFISYDGIYAPLPFRCPNENTFTECSSEFQPDIIEARARHHHGLSSFAMADRPVLRFASGRNMKGLHQIGTPAPGFVAHEVTRSHEAPPPSGPAAAARARKAMPVRMGQRVVENLEVATEIVDAFDSRLRFAFEKLAMILDRESPEDIQEYLIMNGARLIRLFPNFSSDRIEGVLRRGLARMDRWKFETYDEIRIFLLDAGLTRTDLDEIGRRSILPPSRRMPVWRRVVSKIIARGHVYTARDIADQIIARGNTGTSTREDPQRGPVRITLDSVKIPESLEDAERILLMVGLEHGLQWVPDRRDNNRRVLAAPLFRHPAKENFTIESRKGRTSVTFYGVMKAYSRYLASEFRDWGALDPRSIEPVNIMVRNVLGVEKRLPTAGEVIPLKIDRRPDLDSLDSTTEIFAALGRYLADNYGNLESKNFWNSTGRSEQALIVRWAMDYEREIPLLKLANHHQKNLVAAKKHARITVDGIPAETRSYRFTEWSMRRALGLRTRPFLARNLDVRIDEMPVYFMKGRIEQRAATGAAVESAERLLRAVRDVNAYVRDSDLIHVKAMDGLDVKLSTVLRTYWPSLKARLVTEGAAEETLPADATSDEAKSLIYQTVHGGPMIHPDARIYKLRIPRFGKLQSPRSKIRLLELIAESDFATELGDGSDIVYFRAGNGTYVRFDAHLLEMYLDNLRETPKGEPPPWLGRIRIHETKKF